MKKRHGLSREDTGVPTMSGKRNTFQTVQTTSSGPVVSTTLRSFRMLAEGRKYVSGMSGYETVFVFYS